MVIRNIKHIEEMLSKVTPGLWKVNEKNIFAHRPMRVVGKVASVIHNPFDAEFICKAKNEIVPFLIKRCARLEEDNRELRRQLYWLEQEVNRDE